MSGRKSQRATAGNRLRQLLDNELGEDDFYQQQMFLEEEEDVEFAQPDAEEEDQIDSDFDVPEDDGAEEETEEPAEGDEKQKKKVGYVDPMNKRQVQKRAKGKEKEIDEDDEPVKKPRGKPGPKPKPKPLKGSALEKIMSGNDDIDGGSGEAPPQKKKYKKRSLPVPAHEPGLIGDDDEDGMGGDASRKSRRHTTIASSIETGKRQHEASKKASQRATYGAKTKVEYVMTQEDILEEAKETEQWNLEALQMYHQMELEKKTSQRKAVVLTGPRIIYRSVKQKAEAPEETEVDARKGSSSTSTMVTRKSGSSTVVPQPLSLESPGDMEVEESAPELVPTKEQRAFFPVNTVTLKDFDPQQLPANLWPPEGATRLTYPPQLHSPTGLKAKYRDPRTKVPYATIEEYRALQNRRGPNAPMADASKRISKASIVQKNVMKSLRDILSVQAKPVW